MHRLLPLILLLFALLPPVASAQDAEIEAQNLVLTGVPFGVDIRVGEIEVEEGAPLVLQIEGSSFPLETANIEGGRVRVDSVVVERSGTFSMELRSGITVITQATSRAMPGWLSILPPLIAIVIALIFKRVIPALFLGIWIGAWTAIGFSPRGLWTGLLQTFEVYVLSAVADPDRAAIILFSLMIGGMVGIISKNGGTHGVVKHVIGWARSARRGQLATAVMGLVIFFDDYANTLVVGNTMRPVTDRLRVSREKLAYIVDSTAAPIACIALVSTWIGYEVGLIGQAVDGIDGLSMSAYGMFLSSIPFSFYPILAIYFVLAVILSRRDFGPMMSAEVRARSTGLVLGSDAQVDEAVADGDELDPVADKPHRAINAVLPVIVLVAGVLGGLYVTGEGDGLRDIIGSADSYKALMWASLLAAITAGVLSVGQRILTVDETVEAWYSGVKSMLFAMIILVLAWALSNITEVLRTADFLVSVLGQAIPPGTIPAIIFILAAATAFATGTSWGTMGILMPLVVPLTWAVLVENGMTDPEHLHILYSAIASVLAGAVWGDHCSPISDTTILSSMASGCDHIEHVRTQLPYAFVIGAVAVLVGLLPTGFGVPWWLCLPISAAILLGVLFVVGKPIDEALELHAKGETPASNL